MKARELVEGLAEGACLGECEADGVRIQVFREALDESGSEWRDTLVLAVDSERFGVQTLRLSSEEANAVWRLIDDVMPRPGCYDFELK